MAKNYFDRANDIVNEINSSFEIGGKFETLQICGNCFLRFVRDDGEIKSTISYVDNKTMWEVVCAIGNYIEITAKRK